jgi:signal transduction histidine kinase
LQVITGSADSLLEDFQEAGYVDLERIKRYLQSISRNGWRIAELVRALNIYARPSDTPVDAKYLLNDIVNDTLLLIEHQLKTWSNIRIELNLEENIPTFNCDRNEITQILINLITNARDAMPAGGVITLSTSYDAERDGVILEVKDNGLGIPLEIQKLIFDPFFTTKPVDKGTGLGLSIVDGIVRSYGGQIKLSSVPKQGTTLHLFIPRNHPVEERKQKDSGFGRY